MLWKQKEDDTRLSTQGRLRRYQAISRTLVGAGILTVLGGALTFANGLYDVGATTPHAPLVETVLRAGMERSVRNHAEDVHVPRGVDLQDTALAERAIGHYSVACATCHSAPGEPRSPWMVLYPEPADLTKAAVVGQWSDEELYWIIKNGIKDTGMIALGPTHSEQDLWAVAAFVRQLPDLAPERYRELVNAYQAKQASNPHERHQHAH